MCSGSGNLQELTRTYCNVKTVDTEKLRAIINSALNQMSAEAIAALAGGIAAKSVYNFASGTTKEPLRATRRGLDQFAEMWESGLRPKGEYVTGNGTIRADMRPQAGLVPASVHGVIREGQREQMEWVRNFAARLLEAQAAAIRLMDDAFAESEDEVTPPSPEPKPAVGPSKAVAEAEARGAKGVVPRPRRKQA